MFFGRDADIDAFNSLIFVNQIVVLYGKSGYGKSSLINAGIIPKLKASGEWDYFSIRFNNYSDKETEKNLSPSRTTKQRLSDIKLPDRSNLLNRLIPNEDSFWYWIKIRQLYKRESKVIIFFDQFEELFTYPQNQIDEFSEQLSQLLYTTLPLAFRKKLANMEPDSEFSDEEHDFLYQKADVKIIFSIRSDRLSLLNLLKDHHPSILQNSYELDALSIDDARTSIVEPAKLPQRWGFITPPYNFTEHAINRILKSIGDPQDGKIEAATLQIVCRFIEESLIDDREDVTVEEEDIGDITDIFQQYYEGVLEKLIDVQREQAQKLIEDELIDGERRNPLSENYIKSKFGVGEGLLVLLEQSSLLKKERNARGTILYEVSHDSLIGAINKIAENRRTEVRKIELTNERKRADDEKKRADQLNRRLIQVRLTLFIAVLAIIATIFFAVDSNKQKTKAEMSAVQAEIALAKLQAQDLMQRADEFMNVRGDNYKQFALMRYKQALEIMKPYKSRDSLYKVIEDNIKECQEQ